MAPRSRKPVTPTEEERRILADLDRLKDGGEPEDELQRALLWLSLRPGVRPKQAPILTLPPAVMGPLVQALRAHEMGIDVWNVLGYEMRAERALTDPSDRARGQIHPNLAFRIELPPGQDIEEDNLAFFRTGLWKILREIPFALHSFRVRHTLLMALMARGVTRKGANRLFGALWTGMTERKRKPVLCARAESTYRGVSELRERGKSEKQAVKEYGRRHRLTKPEVDGDIKRYRRLYGLPPRRRFATRKPRR